MKSKMKLKHNNNIFFIKNIIIKIEIKQYRYNNIIINS